MQQAGLMRAPLRFTIEPYLQDVRPDGVVIAWSTDVPSTGVVRVDRAAGRSSVRATFNAEPGLHHRTRVVGLLPGQRYRYGVAITRLGDSLGLSVTAEGIEDAAIEERLRQLGCHKGQGWHFGRPMSIGQTRILLAERNLLPSTRMEAQTSSRQIEHPPLIEDEFRKQA